MKEKEIQQIEKLDKREKEEIPISNNKWNNNNNIIQMENSFYFYLLFFKLNLILIFKISTNI